MKKTVLSLIVASAVFAGTNMVNAQAKFPPASSSQAITQGLGISKVSLEYQRPSANGRKIFGGLVPFDQVWRTGANNATAITFENEASINGSKVAPGTYGLFTIPSKEEWTIILNKTAQQWGAYQYKVEDDVLRFKVKPTKIKNKVETFTISFDNVTTSSLDISLVWEDTKVSFPIQVDQSKEIIASIEEAMKGEKKPYFAAAQYYFNNGLDIQKAAEWVKEADKDNTRAPHIKYWKSRILLKAGDKAGAAQAAQEGIDMAKQANNDEYITLNTQALNAAK